MLKVVLEGSKQPDKRGVRSVIHSGHDSSPNASVAILVTCVLGVAVIGLTGWLSEPAIAICLMCAAIILTAHCVLRYDTVFGVYFIICYVYTVFTQIAYVAFPAKLTIVSGAQYYGIEWFWPFYAFIFASFAGAFLLFMIFWNGRYRLHLFSLSNSRMHANARRTIFMGLILVHNLIMIYYAMTSFETLSYYSQDVLKSNRVFFLGFTFYQYTIYTLYIDWSAHTSTGLHRCATFVALVVSALVFMTISIRAGQRIQIAGLLVGLLFYVLGSTEPRNRLRTYAGVALTAIIGLALSNAIRSQRGSQIDLIHVAQLLLTRPLELIRMSAEDIVFQDYTIPSLTLVTSMYHGRVDPIRTALSLVANSFPFLNVPTLGESVSKFIAPYGLQGFGYYAFTEGFEMMGWAGFVYNAVIMNVGLALWRPLARTDNREFDQYMRGIMVMRVFSLVRGDSSAYFKSLYMHFLPCIVLFCLMSGTRLRLHLRTRHP